MWTLLTPAGPESWDSLQPLSRPWHARKTLSEQRGEPR